MSTVTANSTEATNAIVATQGAQVAPVQETIRPIKQLLKLFREEGEQLVPADAEELKKVSASELATLCKYDIDQMNRAQGNMAFRLFYVRRANVIAYDGALPKLKEMMAAGTFANMKRFVETTIPEMLALEIKSDVVGYDNVRAALNHVRDSAGQLTLENVKKNEGAKELIEAAQKGTPQNQLKALRKTLESNGKLPTKKAETTTTTTPVSAAGAGANANAEPPQEDKKANHLFGIRIAIDGKPLVVMFDNEKHTFSFAGTGPEGKPIYGGAHVPQHMDSSSDSFIKAMEAEKRIGAKIKLQ